jgi:hypothetical protein
MLCVDQGRCQHLVFEAFLAGIANGAGRGPEAGIAPPTG